jgi:hypothetical protein
VISYVQTMTKRDGLVTASAAIGINRNTLLSIVAGLPVLAGTVALVRQHMASKVAVQEER